MDFNKQRIITVTAMGNSLKDQAMLSFAWKFAERFGYYAVQFVVQMFLARILAPSDFGAIAIVIALVNVLNVFVQSGLNTAIIQSKEVDNTDLSTVFWISILVAIGCYIIIWVASPIVAAYYAIDYLSSLLRFMSLLLFINAFNSIQVALVMRGLQTKLLMRATLMSSILSGSIGIICAKGGFGVWALALQQVLYQIISCFALSSQIKWLPQLRFSVSRAKKLFGFSWKLLLSSLLDTVYQGAYDLVVGKVFTSSQLGQFSQGKKLPSTLCTLFDNSTKTVLLSVASKVQDDSFAIKQVTRRAMMLSTYAIAPIMTCLLLLSKPIVLLLFGEKWLPAVPFMQLMCVYYAFWPVHTSNLQSLNAIGRSDIYLKLEVIKKVVGVAILLLSVTLTGDIYVVVMGKVIGSLLSIFVNSGPAKTILSYSYLEQIKDIAPAYLISMSAALVSMAPVNFIGETIPSYCIQAVVFVCVYIFVSAAIKSEALQYLLGSIYGLKKAPRK